MLKPSAIRLLAALPLLAAAPHAMAQEARRLEGLAAPARIVVDHWGIAHIYAASTHDAFFVQGYNAARDRLWQIDLWRKRGLGRLAESFGPGFAEKDRAARLFLYRGGMGREWAAYPAGAQAMTQAFADGVNAYIAQVEAGKAPLPREFTLTGTKPERFTAEDIVRIRSHTLVSNAASEATRARAICKGSLKWENLRRFLSPAHEPVVPKGLDPCAVPEKLMRDYVLATGDVSFDGVKLASAEGNVTLALRNINEQGEGSNNWVVDAAHSQTGRPILANDPHRGHGVPSLRYVVDINAPGLHIAGAGEPALPGLTFGHNEVAAWGITIFYADQEDLYVYKISKDHPGAYFYKGAWTPFEVDRQPLAVKGEGARQIELKFTRHGPVIYEDAEKGLAFAMRTVWSEPGASGYFNAAWMFGATQWNDFEIAHQRWGAPPLNLVYADTHGDIGWRASAFVPRRKGWDGLMPVPGDGRYEWQGMVKPDDLPMIKNPARGWVATANQMNLDKGYDSNKQPIGYEWVDRSRIDRIETLLSAKPKLSLADMEAIQTDVTSPLAARSAALVGNVGGLSGDAARAAALLRGWNGYEGVDSAQAALYEIWIARHLRKALAEAVVSPDLQPFFADASIPGVIDWLAALDPRLGSDPAAVRDKVVGLSLAGAWAEATKLLGPDPKAWRWGDLHRADWAPAAARVAPALEKPQWSVGPLQIAGSGSTPAAATYRGAGFGVMAGASVRMVLDVGAWDNSRIINTPGQSGDPQSPHYRDLFPRWAAGQYVPFLFSEAAVKANAESVIELTP
ncbi:penicillin acylase family protein [Novosphingobium sp. SG707]|uniref:penicillin acylase family protein n=1 Tax=Novosphingobium sp. SG707 TaxID=2586996 RepID=UPI001447923F|nr:penicillin acylase family protein [Novosphingobium sp. SG707]NKI98847.1 penicillin amidase [Novosphingobium sp. SG707]